MPARSNGVTPSTTDRLFLVETTEQTLRITVPAGYKMTYGPLINFSPDYGNARGGNNVAVALRIYRTEKDCIALIRDVRSFREIGPIKIELMEVEKGGREVWREDTKGERERSQRRRKQVANAMMGDATTDGTTITFPLLDNLKPNDIPF